MAFMESEISEKTFGWQVETRDNGTCYVPDFVVSVPDYLAVGKPIDRGDAVFDSLESALSDYVPAHHIETIEVCRGYFARLSAPGYLDCTEWECHSTIKGARESLRD